MIAPANLLPAADRSGRNNEIQCGVHAAIQHRHTSGEGGPARRSPDGVGAKAGVVQW